MADETDNDNKTDTEEEAKPNSEASLEEAREELLAEVDGAGRVQLSEAGRKLQFDMNLQQKAMKRIKMDGSEADAFLDELFAEID